MPDARSPLAMRIIEANPNAYHSLVVESDTPAVAHQLLDGVRPEQLLADPNNSTADAKAMLAGLWLWHDGLDESHRISQTLETPNGKFWHAIMHRREGDFSNSKFWYASAGHHPVLATLAAKAGPMIGAAPADNRLLRLILNGWHPAAFVDLVEAAWHHPADSLHSMAVQLQKLEWQILFEHCARG
jgi:hypothetical protein